MYSYIYMYKMFSDTTFANWYLDVMYLVAAKTALSETGKCLLDLYQFFGLLYINSYRMYK